MTPDQLKEFKRLYGTTANADLAVMFQTSENHVKRLAKEHALGKDKSKFRVGVMPRWRPDEVELLKELYPDTPNEEIARQLERTTKSVVAKAHYMKLKKSKERLHQMGLENVALRRDRQ